MCDSDDILRAPQRHRHHTRQTQGDGIHRPLTVVVAHVAIELALLVEILLANGALELSHPGVQRQVRVEVFAELEPAGAKQRNVSDFPGCPKPFDKQNK